MRPTSIQYDPAAMPQKNGQTTSVTVTVTETDLVKITSQDEPLTRKSQVTVYIGGYVLAVSGSNTKIYLRYYVSFDKGGTWYQVPVKNLSTGEVLNLPDMIDSNSPANVAIDLPVSSCNAFKVTTQADLGTATIATASLMVRDN